LVAVADPGAGQVRAHDDKDQLKPALLVNTHFDSAIGAPGASDAGACVAVMLETLRAMRHHPAPRSPVIFLFNGAEESLQQGSHAFSAHHPWASRVRAVVNMDSAGLHFFFLSLSVSLPVWYGLCGPGGGGPALLVQSGSAAVTRAYAQAAPRPHGSSIAQDLFANGVIPSDTDYRNFKECVFASSMHGEERDTDEWVYWRSHANISGLDLVYYRNGYTYHTDRDTPDRMEPGSLQVFIFLSLSFLVHTHIILTRSILAATCWLHCRRWRTIPSSRPTARGWRPAVSALSTLICSAMRW
jgi:hypothetical protein